MNLQEIQDLIKFVSKSGVSEVKIAQKDFKIVIKAEQKKAIERFETWMDSLYLQTLTDELKNTIIETVHDLIDEIEELND